MKKIIDCFSPRRIFNKYLGEFVQVNCGSCPACMSRKARQWTARLELERSRHPFCFFITLTYSEQFLPLLYPQSIFSFEDSSKHYFEDGHVYSNLRDSLSYKYADFEFDTDKDSEYFKSCISVYGGIPYCSKNDVQLFNKRLNKYFKDNVTGSYKNFRYFLVSELGSTTFRPHFHGIYFVDSEKVSNSFFEGVRKSWQRYNIPIGIIDCQLVEKSACSYVAQYLNEPFNYPSFYKKGLLKPFYLASRRDGIGNVHVDSSSLQKILDSGAVEQVVQKSAHGLSFVAVPLQRYVENKLYPKFSFFDKVSDSLRIKLYRIASYFVGSEGMNEPSAVRCFVSNVKAFILSDIRNSTLVELRSYLLSITQNVETADNNLKRLFYVSRTFLNNCVKFGYGVYSYVSKIVEYFSRRDYNRLCKFMQFQQDFSSDLVGSVLPSGFDLSDLAYLYPEFAHKNADVLGDLSVRPFFKMMVSETVAYKVARTKSHFKNHYFDSLKNRNFSLFNLISSYNAKECNEVNQTFAPSCKE